MQPKTKLSNRARNPANQTFARLQRANMSYSERVLWASIRRDRLGFRFRRQVPIGPYVLDFYCPEALLCVEVDGDQHIGREGRDARRDAFLAEQGILTLRIRSLDLFDGFAYTQAYKELIDLLEARTGRAARKPSEL